jgi:PRTRC genetic system protein C
MEVTELLRVFKHGDIELADIDPVKSADQVLDFYSGQYPELTNASVTGPEVVNDKLEYKFSTSVGTKG